MSISVAIIAKNEEDVIDRCINSVMQFADEIIMVDTGSTDNTTEIARSFDVQTFESNFFDESTDISDFQFNVARNEAISKCTKDWIIWWDADDIIDSENAYKIKSLGLSYPNNAYSFKIKSCGIEFEQTRMFPNHKGIEFDKFHSCHEYIDIKGLTTQSIRDVQIQHAPGKKHISSASRNVAIMETDYFVRGYDDQRTLFYLATAYRESERDAEAIEFYDKYLEKSNWSEERFFARYFKAHGYLKLGDIQRAQKESILSIAEDFRFAESYCLLGDIAFCQSDFARAQAWFMMASATPVPDAKLFVSPGLYSDYPNQRISDCHSAMTDIKNTNTPFGGVYILPEDKDEAIIACCALASLGKEIGIANHEDLSRNLPNIHFMQSDSHRQLCLPNDLKGRTKIEWYCRSAGHVVSDWNNIISEAERLIRECL